MLQPISRINNVGIVKSKEYAHLLKRVEKLRQNKDLQRCLGFLGEAEYKAFKNMTTDEIIRAYFS